MEKLTDNLQQNQEAVKGLLPAEDILTFAFESADSVPCLLVYADGMVNKELLGEQVAQPLQRIALPEGEGLKDVVKTTCRFPECKEVENLRDCGREILDGNTLLLVDGMAVGLVFGAKLLPNRTVAEPPTDVAVKGPREGFIEDVKTNMTLVRKRLKSPDLRLETSRIGRRSDSIVCLCYLDGIVNEQVKAEVEQRLQRW